jgi:BrnA antitoxin of type II toxin-antitoxin system
MWLKAHGRGYQTRINRILRAAMESHPPSLFAFHLSSGQERQTTSRAEAGVTFHEGSN